MQQAEESAAEPEAQGRGAVFLIRQRGVVDGQLVQGLREFAVLVRIDRIDRGKDDLLRLLVAGDRFGRRAVEVGDRIADFDLPHALDSGDDVAHLAGAELLLGIELQPIDPHFLHRVIPARVHEMDGVAGFHRAIHDAALEDHPAIAIELRVEDERFQRPGRVALGARQLLDDSRQHVLNADAGLGRDGDRRERIEPQVLIDLFTHPLDIGGGQIDLVDYRQQFQVVIQRQVEVGDRLRLDALGGIDDDQRAVARQERAPHLVRKIDMPRGVDQVQLIVLPVGGAVGERDRIALDRDPPLALDIHRVEQLVAKLALRNAATGLDQPIGQGRFPMVNMGDDAEVTNMVHETC